MKSRQPNSEENCHVIFIPESTKDVLALFKATSWYHEPRSFYSGCRVSVPQELINDLPFNGLNEDLIDKLFGTEWPAQASKDFKKLQEDFHNQRNRSFSSQFKKNRHYQGCFIKGLINKHFPIMDNEEYFNITFFSSKDNFKIFPVSSRNLDALIPDVEDNLVALLADSMRDAFDVGSDYEFTLEEKRIHDDGLVTHAVSFRRTKYGYHCYQISDSLRK